MKFNSATAAKKRNLIKHHYDLLYFIIHLLIIANELKIYKIYAVRILLIFALFFLFSYILSTCSS